MKKCKPGALLDSVRKWRQVHTCRLVEDHPGRCRCACGAKTRAPKPQVAA